MRWENYPTSLENTTPRLGRQALFLAHMLIEDIFYLGDTRSADDLAVFTTLLRVWITSGGAICSPGYR